MEHIYQSVEQLIGRTPLIELTHIEKMLPHTARILAKLEYLNPTGSAKDRAALSMLNAAESSGELSSGGTIIEPTSGNTGIGLACIGAARGYRVIIVMPDSMSQERIRMMKAYGAEVVLTPGYLGMKGAIEKASELKAQHSNSFIPNQFDNSFNSKAHYDTTGPEIWDDAGGKIDFFIAGIGTGGTITGIGHYLKEMNPDIRIIGFEPETSPLISKGYSGKHDLQGIGANFIPSIFDHNVCDRILTVSDRDAYQAGRMLGAREGIFTGITSGAAIHVAIMLASLPENEGKTIVAFLPDSGDRYLSSAMFAEQE